MCVHTCLQARVCWGRGAARPGLASLAVTTAPQSPAGPPPTSKPTVHSRFTLQTLETRRMFSLNRGLSAPHRGAELLLSPKDPSSYRIAKTSSDGVTGLGRGASPRPLQTPGS